MVSVNVLRSSSSGNSTLIWNEKDAILVDCGLGPRVTEQLLQSHGFSMRDLSGVLVTHAHNDHGKATTIAKLFRHKIPVYCLPGVKAAVMRSLTDKRKHQFQTISEDPFTIGSFTITSFQVHHDSEGGCAGFCVFSGDGEAVRKISLVTDYGKPDSIISQRLRDSHLILIASNYDSGLIDDTSAVPEYVKRKHILPYQPSNDECASVLSRAVQFSTILPQVAYLLHISKNHNTVERAVASSQSILDAAGYGQIRILPTYRDAFSETTHLK
jgi:phosphoribosyl 1,2-cyclic phosphodiesterase